MNGGLTANYYFSQDIKIEARLKKTFWLMILVLGAVLVIFWEQLRDLEHINFLYYAVAGTYWELFFRGFTFLGDNEGFILIVVLVYWCINKSLGFWTMMVLLLSGALNFIMKEVTGLPRPQIPGVYSPHNPAFPSGHTLCSLTIWGHLAVWFRHRVFWIGSLIVIIMVGISRLFLGYHFIGDVIGGVVVGCLFLAVYLKVWKLSISYVRGITFQIKLGLVIILGLLSFWAVIYLPLTSDLVMVLGLLFGGCLGYLLEKESLNFRTEGSIFQYIMRIFLGGIVGAVIMLILLPVFSHNALLSFLFHILGSFWIFYLAPLVFVKIGIAQTD